MIWKKALDIRNKWPIKLKKNGYRENRSQEKHPANESPNNKNDIIFNLLEK